MSGTDSFFTSLNSWSPRVANQLIVLSYIGSRPFTRWLTDSPLQAELGELFEESGLEASVVLWRRAIKDKVELPAASLLLILEHIRSRPSEAAFKLRRMGFVLSKTVPLLSFMAAKYIYEDAKHSFSRHEIDTAVARLQVALSEFRFSIESNQISDPTRMLATGMYSSSVAMIGRWVDVSASTVMRALQYSVQSLTLGNIKVEHLHYRLQLLVLHFDQTGEVGSLTTALDLIKGNKSLAVGSELIEAEVAFRLAMDCGTNSIGLKDNLEYAKSCLNSFKPRASGGVDEARATALGVMISEAQSGRLVLSARLAAIPRGVLAQMATKPSEDLWRSIKGINRSLKRLQERGSIPAAVLMASFLRQMVEGPRDLLKHRAVSQYEAVAKYIADNAAYNRHNHWEAGAAALCVAEIVGKRNFALGAAARFRRLAVLDQKWPLPRIGIARVEDLLSDRAVGIGHTSGEWVKAATLTLNSPNYARSNLGGRNEVFAVADARGFISEAFVFKRTTREKAQHEARMLGILRAEILAAGKQTIFEVPRSLAIVEVRSADERKWVHVTQRSAGRLVSDLSQSEAADVFQPIVELLAMFHRIAGVAAPEKSGWRPVKDHLRMWSKALFRSEKVDAFVDSLRQSFPAELPLVRKRDGHASNWIVDPAGRIVAIDFESVDFIPAGYDVAQLVEDNALIEPSAEGWTKRIKLMDFYLREVHVEASKEYVESAYGWFAIARALRLGTERSAGKALKRHARELCMMLSEHAAPNLGAMARELLSALSRTDHIDSQDSSPSHDHRRLSKAMAFLLRHHGPDNGLNVDSSGFSLLEDLASLLGVDSADVLSVAEHPGEPRFEVRGGYVRALYGHSLDVVIDVGITIGAPQALFHGSTWGVIDEVMTAGLLPMRRKRVHLTNTPSEALSVSERKGPSVLLSVEQDGKEEPVAEGIWVVPQVSRDRLKIINPFTEESGVVL